MKGKLIYVVDDEKNICNIIQSFLVKEGFEVETFQDGRAALEQFRRRPADLLVLDIMMPGLDGYSLCSAVRQTSNVPIVFVSARDTEPDKVAGFTLGGDDYLTKPFSPLELVARIKRMFQRMELDRSHRTGAKTVFIGNVVIDPDARRAEVQGRDVRLTNMEFSLLLYLAMNKNRAVGRNELLNKIWGFESEVESRATDDMIKRIRRKLSDAGADLKIETVRAFGFAIYDKR